MIKIALLIPLWKRPELTRLLFQNIKRIIQYKPETFEVKPIFAVSEKWCEDLCNEFGYDFVFVENNPLGAKMNAALKKIINDQFDWLITNGSDDFIEPKFLDDYLPHFQTKKAFGISIVNLINQDTKEQKQWPIGYAFGALRCVRFDIVKKVAVRGESFEGFWPKHLNKGLDFYSMERLKQVTGIDIEVVTIKTKLWDVKSPDSINRWSKIKGWPLDEPVKNLPKELRTIFQNSPSKTSDFSTGSAGLS